MRLCELRQKEVINVCSCASLGCVIDVDIDPKSGQVLALIVPGPGRFSSWFGREHECRFPGAVSVRLEKKSFLWNWKILIHPGTDLRPPFSDREHIHLPRHAFR